MNAVTSLLATALLFGIVAGFILERRLMVRDQKTERLEWTRERSELLNRIKPETAQPVQMDSTESFENLVLEGPQADEAYWEDSRN